MPKISIIIPVYNVDKYIEKTINYLIEQTYSDFEIICVNDGSTDNSLKILNKMSKVDNRIRIINKKNTGAGDSRNKGLEESKGEYVIFLDADDIFLPNMLDVNMKALLSDTSIDMTFFCYSSYYNKTKKIVPKPFQTQKLIDDNKYILNTNDIKKYGFHITNHTPWNKVYKKSFIIKNNLKFSNLDSNNDVSFVISSYTKAEKIYFIKDTLLYYREFREGSISKTRSKKPFNIIKALKEVEDFLDKENLLNEFSKPYYTFMITSLATGIQASEKSIVEQYYNETKLLLSDEKHMKLMDREEKTSAADEHKRIINNSYTSYKVKYIILKRFLSVRIKNNKKTYKFLSIPILQKESLESQITYKVLGIKI